ncbi:MAG: response regulator [Gammaproteobacteria bacterium]|nr:response regulator [Gammaproteobacteria bacterium]
MADLNPERPALPHDAGNRILVREHSSEIDGIGSSLTEVAQAKVRIMSEMLVMVIAAYAVSEKAIALPLVVGTFTVSYSFAAILYFWAKRVLHLAENSRERRMQRIAAISADIVFAAWCMHIGGPWLSVCVGGYLQVIFANGFRFGYRYLVFATVLSLVSFLLVALTTPFWAELPLLTTGLMMSIAFLPVYFARLLKKLDQALVAAEAAYAAKSTFLSKMSHELRTPLHGIIATADLLVNSELDRREHEMARIISVSSSTLLDLINRVLDLAKLDAGARTLKRSDRFNFHNVLNDTYNVLLPQARRKNLQLAAYIDPEIELYVRGYPEELKEVLINIAGNAVKFTSEGSVHISAVSVQAPVQGRRKVRMEVHDTGPGIAADKLKEIFNPFYQVDNSATRTHGGTGLGMSISREIVRLMGSDIQIESVEGIGTRMWFDIELETATGEDITHIYPARIATVGFGADDEPLLRELARFGATIVGRCDATLNGLRGMQETLSQTEAMLINLDVCNGAADVLDYIDEIRATSEMDITVISTGSSALIPIARRRGYAIHIPLRGDVISVRAALNLLTSRRRVYTTDAKRYAATQPYRILVAEDNPTNQRIIKMILAEAGYQVSIVEDGEAALDELTSSHYDLAILDWHMPVYSGVEVARLYRFAHRESAVPLIMMTADASTEARESAEAAGIDRFLTKPMRATDVLAEVYKSLAAANPVAVKPAEKELPAEPVRSDVTATIPVSAKVTPYKPRAVKPVRDDALIDQAIIDELCGYLETTEMRASFVEEFLEDATRTIATLEAFDGDETQWPRMTGEVHALCGSSRCIGAKMLSEHAKRVELMKYAEYVATRDKQLAEMHRLLDASEVQLRRHYGLDRQQA